MTLIELDELLYYELLSLSFTVTWEGYPTVFMGDVVVNGVYIGLMMGEGE